MYRKVLEKLNLSSVYSFSSKNKDFHGNTDYKKHYNIYALYKCDFLLGIVSLYISYLLLHNLVSSLSIWNVESHKRIKV